MRYNVDHAQVIDYYTTNHIALFLSLSSREGLPVSLMEAISCGIPLLATTVGGVSEVVNENTGRLAPIFQ
jgi:colanic acid/amylovoran biosynthesis glycosyltransferase